MPTDQILVVEDERVVASAIKSELEQFGYDVRDSASSAAEAVDVEAQKMRAVSRFAGGIAHHLNNLLTVILSNTSLALSQRLEENEIKHALGRVEVAGHRAADLIQQLLRFSGRGRAQLGRVDLNTLLLGFMNSIKSHLDSRIKVVISPNYDLWQVNADAVQMGQALLNLCRNAQDAMPGGGQLTLESE